MFLLGLAAVLVFREITHFSEPFLHNGIDTFLDVLCGVSALLLVANAFGFRGVSWARTVGPVLAAVATVDLASRLGLTFKTPGFRLAAWAVLSPWDGHLPRGFLWDVDPWLSLAVDLLIFTTVFSLILIGFQFAPARSVPSAKAI
jgi:hypothetical protein